MLKKICWLLDQQNFNEMNPAAFQISFSEWNPEDRGPEEAHLQTGPGRVHRPGEDREHLHGKSVCGPDIRARGESTSEYNSNTWFTLDTGCCCMRSAVLHHGTIVDGESLQPPLVKGRLRYR